MAPPRMPLWVNDFLGSARVRDLDWDERALYLYLLALEWQADGQGLPDPRTTREAQVAFCRQIGRHGDGTRAGRMPAWCRRYARVLELFEARGDRLYSPKLESELTAAKELNSTRSEAASKAAAVRWHASRMHPSPSPSPSPSEEEHPPSEDAPLKPSAKNRQREIEPGWRETWSLHVQHWQTLATELGLVPIRRGSADERRWKKLQRRLAEHQGDFWRDVALALRRRSRWARDNRFPTFDQLVQPRLLTRLLEGAYEGQDARSHDQAWEIIQEVVEERQR